MTLKYIFAKPEFIDGIGDVYPIKLKNYDEFVDCSTILYYKKDHFKVDENVDLSLLDLLCFGLQDNNVTQILVKLFSLVLKRDVKYYTDENVYGFIVDAENGLGIDGRNFDRLREVIMRQNLMHEQKVWKDPLLAEFARYQQEVESRNSIKMGIEDMVTTVAMFSGKTYEEISEFTIYQLKASFHRVNKFKNYDTTVAFKCVGSDAPLGHFAEQVDLFEDSSKDLLKGNLDKLNSALG